jgi:hypothetical protein
LSQTILAGSVASDRAFEQGRSRDEECRTVRHQTTWKQICRQGGCDLEHNFRWPFLVRSVMKRDFVSRIQKIILSWGIKPWPRIKEPRLPFYLRQGNQKIAN